MKLNLFLYLSGTAVVALTAVLKSNPIGRYLLLVTVIAFLFQASFALLAQGMFVIVGEADGGFDISPVLAVLLAAVLLFILFSQISLRREIAAYLA